MNLNLILSDLYNSNWPKGFNSSQIAAIIPEIQKLDLPTIRKQSMFIVQDNKHLAGTDFHDTFIKPLEECLAQK